MKRYLFVMFSGLLLVMLCASASGQEEAEKSYTVWIGGHYTDFSDYQKKVGEYRITNEELLPELMLDYRSFSDGSVFTFNGRYFDHRNIRGNLHTRVGDVFSAEFRYKSLVHQEGQDLLENLETREWLGDKPGGKILTHEILDPDAHYYTHRQEIEGKVTGLLSRKHNIKLMVAHRSVLQEGKEQSLSNNHCFSCHVVSQSAEVDKVTHQMKATIQGDIAKQTLGYDFAYRIFNSRGTPAYGMYDPAKHPVRGDAVAEFSSRVIYDDTTLPVNVYPETEKFQHKVRMKGNLGDGRYASALSFSRAKNKNTDLVSTAWAGNVNVSYPLGKKTRLIAKAAGTRLRTDDVFIDLPLYREGRPGPQTSFDFTRYSSLDRADARGSLELISRLSRRWTGSVLLGYRYIDRYDYPDPGDGTTTNRFIGQLKLRYSKGMRYSSNVKYRIELTSDPFVSGRGIFEARGETVLEPIILNDSHPIFVYYWQREDLRYQSITTEPTQEHIFEWSSRWRPTNKIHVNVGLNGSYDKNGDLDSLDVSHVHLQPHLSLNLNPNPNWSFMAGGSLIHNKSRGPVAVALFDG